MIDGAIPLLEPGSRTGKSTDDKRCSDGIGKAGDPMFTLQGSRTHGVAWPAEVSPTLNTSWGDRSAGSQAQEFDSERGGRFVPGPRPGPHE